MDREHSNAQQDDDERDDLDELIAEIAQKHPDFPTLLEEAWQRRMAMVARGEDPNGPPDPDSEKEPKDETPPVAVSHLEL